MSSPTELDTKLIDEIVCKVKSEGLFDQFRRECLADVDTKPAFQNVQQRVEMAVSSFLNGSEWTAQLNKNQLREKLRKSINNEGFFEAGIERIVDQVVNPKLNSNLVPKIQDVAYKFLGIEKPLFNTHFEVKIEPNTEILLELEQVDSPESDKSLALHALGDDEMREVIHEKADDLESPAFEPIECASDIKIKHEYIERQDDDMDISDGDDVPLQMNGSMLIPNDEAKSNMSSISGLTSSDSQNECTAGITDADIAVKTECKFDAYESWNGSDEKDSESLLAPQLPTEPCLAPEISLDTAQKLPQTENVISTDVLIEHMSQDSVLSQVSSTSRLSIITNNNTNTRMDDGDSNHIEIDTSNCEKAATNTCPYDISEEAQMQKFNESSSSNNSLIIDTENVSNGTNKFEGKCVERMTSFDIKRQEIKFEGTSRKSFDVSENGDSDSKQASNDAISVNSTTELIKDDKSNKSDEHNYDESESIGDAETKNESIGSDKVSYDTKSTNNVDTDDSKPTDDSNSSNHKLKDRTRGGKISSRNGNDSEHHKHRSKDRPHHSSSKDRHRDKDRDRSKSSSSKDKPRSLRDESESRDSTSKHRDSISNSSKHSANNKHDDQNKISQHKSSSKDRPKSDKHPVSSTSSNSHSSSSKKEHSRHSSSSSSKDKDISKRDSKHSDSKRHRSDTHRTSSKKDDHYTHKEKPTARPRSRSKDSNDGHHRLSQSNIARHCSSVDQTSSIEKAEAGSSSSTKEPQPITSHTITACTSEAEPSVIETKMEIEVSTLHGQPLQLPTSSEEDDKFVMVTQPVCVDQILTGKELNLELFIGENRNDPVVSSIEQSLEPTIKKPKLAANIFEARKLAKLRKEMELDEQKKVEKATVLAKQYIRSNASSLRGNSSQGIELEFVCTKSDTGEGKTIGPTISSPIKYANGVKLPETSRHIPTATVTSSSAPVTDSTEYTEPSVESSSTEIAFSSDDEKECFYGFNTIDIQARTDRLKLLEAADTKVKKAMSKVKGKMTSKQISSLMDGDQEELIDMLTGDNQQLFFENNKIGKNGVTSASKILNRKRKPETTVSTPVNSSTEVNTADDMIVASVVISQTNKESNIKPDSSTRPETDARTALEKQRQKTRYSNEDLFKPRPVLGGGSRSRRRGVNCNE